MTPLKHGMHLVMRLPGNTTPEMYLKSLGYSVNLMLKCYHNRGRLRYNDILIISKD